MTIAKTKDGNITLSWNGWGNETPAFFKKIGYYLLGACAFWALFQSSLPFTIKPDTMAVINRWALFVPAAYRFLIQWTHKNPTIADYSADFNPDKFGKN